MARYTDIVLVLASLLALPYALSSNLYTSTNLNSSCEVELDLISVPSSEQCITLKWRLVENCKGSLHVQPFELLVCNGTQYKSHITNVHQMKVSFSRLYCDPYCIICTNTSDVCVLFNSSATKNCKYVHAGIAVKLLSD